MAGIGRDNKKGHSRRDGNFLTQGIYLRKSLLGGYHHQYQQQNYTVMHQDIFQRLKDS
jgi:hypothetical protein